MEEERLEELKKTAAKLIQTADDESNRGETREEEVARFAKEITSCRDTSNFDWQISKGAEIRGKMGVEQGNKFIEDIKKYT